MSTRFVKPIFTLAMIVVSGCSKLPEKLDQSVSADNQNGNGLLDYLGGGDTATSPGGAVTKPLGMGIVEMDWDLDSGQLYQSGLGASKMTTFLDFGGTVGKSFCFENTKHMFNCQVAKKDTRDVIGSEPVAVQGFHLNFAKQSYNRHGQNYASFAVEGGWVATAELRFNSATGKMSLGNPGITKIYNGECDLSDTSGFTVGYLDRTRVLTGLYLSDEYAVTASSYSDAFLHAGRVHYSGLVPNPSVASAGSSGDTCQGVYCWKFQTRPQGSSTTPDNKAVTADWGVKSFSTTDSLTSKASGYFGLTSQSALPRWDSHVVIGFCIKGHKTEQNGTKRPLVHYSVARTHAPSLVFKR